VVQADDEGNLLGRPLRLAPDLYDQPILIPKTRFRMTTIVKKPKNPLKSHSTT